MRLILERTRHQLYLTMSRYFVICWALERYKEETFSQGRSWLNFCSFIVFIVPLVLWSLFRLMISSPLNLCFAMLIDIFWHTVVRAIITIFGAATDCPACGIMDAHLGWQDVEPRNSVPLHLFRFKGQVLFISGRFLVFSPDVDENYYEAIRLLRIIASVDNSVYISGIDSVVCIYNISPYATADEETNTIHLQLPYRCDIRLRSWLKYSVTICNENNVHNGLVNADTFSKMVPAIRDSYNVWENRHHFSIMNLVKSILIPLVPAVLITASFRVTKWDFLEWVGENEIEIFFGVIGSISLFRVLRQDAPIRYERLSHVSERVEQVARLVTDSPNDASAESTAWHACKTFGSVDCQIKNGMEALMLAFILVYERGDGRLQAICLDRELECMEVQGETNGISEQEIPNSKRTLLMKWTGEKNRTQIDSAVGMYNEKFDEVVPANVWLGRPLRTMDTRTAERSHLLVSKYNGETYREKPKTRSAVTGQLF